MKKFLILFSVAMCVAVSCTKPILSSNTSFTPSCSGNRLFATDVKPLITSFCATTGCHDSGSKKGPGALTTYAQIFASKSAIRSSIVSGSMPRGSSLTTDQKNAIICWIDAGGLNN